MKRLLVLIITFVVSLSAAAEERELKTDTKDHVNAILLLDSSGSMRVTDPLRLRDEGAKLFVESLKSEDKLGIVDFSNQAKIVRPLSPVGSDDPSKIESVISSVGNSGTYTNILSAIKTAKSMFEGVQDPDANQVVIVLSDGKMEPDPSEGKPDALTKDLLDNYLPDLKAKGIKVYTLAFSDQADKDLLNQISAATDSVAWFTPTADKIHESYTNLFLAVKKPQVLALTGKGFTIDRDIQEATFYANRAADGVEISLKAPDGRVITSSSTDKNVKWFKGQKFDVITIRTPDEGDWQMLGVPEDDQGFATVLTNLKLVTDWTQIVFSDSPELVQARLYDGKKPLALSELSGVTEYTVIVTPTDKISEPVVRTPLYDDGTHGDKISGDGIFSALVTVANAGDFKLGITAHSATFDRSQQIPFRVKPRIVSLTVIPAEEKAKPESSEEAEKKAPSDIFRVELDPDAASMKNTQVKLLAVNEKRTRMTLPLVQGKTNPLIYEFPASSLPADGTYELRATLTAESKKEKKFAAESQTIHYTRTLNVKEIPVPTVGIVVEEPEENPAPFWGGLGIIILLNGVIGFVCLATLRKTQTQIGFATPNFVPLDGFLKIIEGLREQSAATSIDLNDPLLQGDRPSPPQRSASIARPAAPAESAPSPDAADAPPEEAPEAAASGEPSDGAGGDAAGSEEEEEEEQ